MTAEGLGPQTVLRAQLESAASAEMLLFARGHRDLTRRRPRWRLGS